LHLPPFLLRQELPGFDRLQRALALAKEAAFVPEGMLCWLNAIRPAGALSTRTGIGMNSFDQPGAPATGPVPVAGAPGWWRKYESIPSVCLELTEVPLTVKAVADATEAAFRQRVPWWGG
jgi:hypothetical protein